jgi:hypothetical protein
VAELQQFDHGARSVGRNVHRRSRRVAWPARHGTVAGVPPGHNHGTVAAMQRRGRRRANEGRRAMRALVGIVGLLVALAIVGTLAMKQLRATGQAVQQAAPEAAAGGTTVREQSQQVQRRVESGVGQMLQQGADKRADEAAK